MKSLLWYITLAFIKGLVLKKNYTPYGEIKTGLTYEYTQLTFQEYYQSSVLL